MLKNIRDYFLMVSLLFSFNCMTKKQNIVLPEFELSYSDVIYKSDHPESPDHIFYIKSDHISTGCESSFSDKGYYSMEKRRKEIYKNILLTLEKLTRNHGLDLVGLESLNLGTQFLRVNQDIQAKSLKTSLIAFSEEQIICPVL